MSRSYVTGEPSARQTRRNLHPDDDSSTDEVQRALRLLDEEEERSGGWVRSSYKSHATSYKRGGGWLRISP